MSELTHMQRLPRTVICTGMIITLVFGYMVYRVVMHLAEPPHDWRWTFACGVQGLGQRLAWDTGDIITIELGSRDNCRLGAPAVEAPLWVSTCRDAQHLHNLHSITEMQQLGWDERPTIGGEPLPTGGVCLGGDDGVAVYVGGRLHWARLGGNDRYVISIDGLHAAASLPMSFALATQVLGEMTDSVREGESRYLRGW